MYYERMSLPLFNILDQYNCAQSVEFYLLTYMSLILFMGENRTQDADFWEMSQQIKIRQPCFIRLLCSVRLSAEVLLSFPLTLLRSEDIPVSYVRNWLLPLKPWPPKMFSLCWPTDASSLGFAATNMQQGQIHNINRTRFSLKSILMFNSLLLSTVGLQTKIRQTLKREIFLEMGNSVLQQKICPAMIISKCM